MMCVQIHTAYKSLMAVDFSTLNAILWHGPVAINWRAEFPMYNVKITPCQLLWKLSKDLNVIGLCSHDPGQDLINQLRERILAAVVTN